jgi:hypothetical protein
MTVTCPSCGWSKDIPAEKIPVEGAKGTCPKCQTKFEVKREPEPSAESSPINRTPIQKDVKPCPFCGGEVLAGAIKCKHCKKMLDVNDVKSKTEPDGITEPLLSEDTQRVEQTVQIEGKQPFYKKLSKKAMYHIIFCIYIIAIGTKVFMVGPKDLAPIFPFFFFYFIFIVISEYKKFGKVVPATIKPKVINIFTWLVSVFFIVMSLTGFTPEPTAEEKLARAKDAELRKIESMRKKTEKDKQKADAELKKAAQVEKDNAKAEEDRRIAAEAKLKVEDDLNKAALDRYEKQKAANAAPQAPTPQYTPAPSTNRPFKSDSLERLHAREEACKSGILSISKDLDWYKENIIKLTAEIEIDRGYLENPGQFKVDRRQQALESIREHTIDLKKTLSTFKEMEASSTLGIKEMKKTRDDNRKEIELRK